jgi:hypothetical protein
MDRNHPPAVPAQTGGIDAPTVIAVAIIAYAFANLLHEAVGHGGACLLVGGTPLTLSSMHFDGDFTGFPRWAGRVVAAGGTLVNFIAAAVALFFWRRTSGSPSVANYFLWLFGVVNLMQGTGYLLFSGVAGVGDWAEVVGGLPFQFGWHAALAIVGGVSYWLSVRFAFRALAPYLSRDLTVRHRRAVKLALVPYVSGGVLYVVAGLLNPLGLIIVLISAVAASFGGTSGLAWGVQLLRRSGTSSHPEAPAGIQRSKGWIAAAAAVAIVFVAVLGPGVKL